MRASGGDSFQWMAKAVRFLEGGLARTEQRCLGCGGRAASEWGAPDRVPRLPKLCRQCRDAVPWIDRIVCASCGRPEACPDCSRRKEPIIAASRSAVRYTPLMKEWLARYKYRGSERLFPLFECMLSFAFGHLREEWKEKGCHRARTVLTYVPLSEERLGERGFNQAESMASGLGRRFRLPVIPLLVRSLHTGKQSDKSRRERLGSLEGAFAPEPEGLRLLRDYARLGPVNVVITDDVYTTGNTLHRCGETIWTGMAGTPFSSSGTLNLYGVTWAR